MTPEAAALLDAELANLLNAEGDVADRLRVALQGYEETSRFLDRVLNDAPYFRPPQLIPPRVRSYSGLPGHGGPIDADRFGCPRGDYIWYRIEVGAEVGYCPTHRGCRLQPIPSG